MTLLEKIQSTIKWVRYRTDKGVPGSKAIYTGKDGQANIKLFPKK